MTTSEKALQAALALWMMAGPTPRHTSPDHEQAFETPLQPMTLCLLSGTFKTQDEYNIRSKEV